MTYSSTPGKTTIYSTYDPNRGPAAKAPEAGSSQEIPFLPAGAMADFLAKQAEMARYTQYSFPDLPPAKAPGGTAPLVSTPTASWEGLQFTGFQRPTPDLAVGPSDVLMVVNSSIGQFSKSGTAKKVTLLADWFSDVLPSICPTTCQLYDPWIAYDQLHGHFLLLVSAAPNQSRTYSFSLLSVSNGPTYDGGWKNWALNASLDGTVQTPNWGDSWRLGFDNVAVYLAGNMYNSNFAFQYAKMRVIKKTDLYNPATTALTYQEIGSGTAKLRNADGTLADSLMPAHLRGQPGAAAVGLLVNAANLSALPATYLTVWKINDPLATPVTATQSTVTGMMSYTVPAPAPQLGSNSTISAGDTRLLKAIYRNGFLYTGRDTGYPDQATTVTTDVIDTATMKLSSQSRVLNANAFFPAFDVPATVPLGTQFATANLVTGTTTSPTGALTFPGLSNSLKAGVDAYAVASSGATPWGDYFGGAVDPLSGGLWVSGAFAKQSQVGFGQWGTWAGYYPWLTLQSFNDVPGASPFFDYINVLSSWGITTGCASTPALFCPTDLVTREQLATLIIRSMMGDNFTYTAAPYYTDVPSSSPYFRYIQKMTDLGIVHGCAAAMFCPGGNVPRGDAAVMLVRGKLESLAGDNFTYPGTPFFTDVPGGLPQFRYVQKMYELGLTTGCSATQFCPNSLLTRQEIAVFLTRAFLN